MGSYDTTDPHAYDVRYQKFISNGLPADEQGWVDSAALVAQRGGMSIMYPQKPRLRSSKPRGF